MSTFVERKQTADRAELEVLRSDRARLEAEVGQLRMENRSLAHRIKMESRDGALLQVVAPSRRGKGPLAFTQKNMELIQASLKALGAERDRLTRELRDALAEIERLREVSRQAGVAAWRLEGPAIQRDEQGVVEVHLYPGVTQAPPPPPRITGGTGDPGIKKKQLPLLLGLKPDVLAKVKEERAKHIAAHSVQPKRKVLAAAVGISVSRLGDYLKYIRENDR